MSSTRDYIFGFKLVEASKAEIKNKRDLNNSQFLQNTRNNCFSEKDTLLHTKNCFNEPYNDVQPLYPF